MNPYRRVEAFSGNALYYHRGMSMKQYKTVKEVCALTGLTGKHLYYFHHANIVRATAYANYSVQGHDGYKLYDDDAVEKLRQIALYYQLGLKRNEICDLVRSPDYDCQRKKLDVQIAALEYLQRVGVQEALKNGCDLQTLGEKQLENRQTATHDALVGV